MLWQRTTSGWEALAPAGGAPTWASITSKPTTIAGFGITDFNSLGDARWSLLGHTHTFASLTSIPTTIAGYGITDFNALGDARWGQLSAAIIWTSATPMQWRTGTNGYMALSAGNASVTGWVGWYLPTGVRQGYMGFDAAGIGLHMEVGDFTVTGNTRVTGIVNIGTGGLNGGLVAESGATLFNFGANEDSGNRFGGAYTSANQGGMLRIAAVASGSPLFQFYGRVAGATTAVTLLASITSTGVATFGGTLSADGYFSSTTGGVQKAYYGVAQSANHIVTGSATGDGVLRLVSGAAFRFSVDNGVSTNAYIANGNILTSPSTGTNAAYYVCQNTGGTYYIGVDNSANTAFGFGAYNFGLYTPAGVAWYVNRTTNAMTIAGAVTMNAGGSLVGLWGFTNTIPTITVSGASTRNVACAVISTVAPVNGTDTAPTGTIWFQY